ncbi:MAG: hypothetical protein V2A79_09845 [Planctomycetota bacterium]
MTSDERRNSPDLRDPLAQLLEEMRTNPDDAAVIAQFLDVGVLTRMFKERGYNAAKKIATLLDIIDKGTHTEKMRAMKMLDEIWEQALVRRGMLGGGTALPLPGGMTPLGLPAPVRRVESVEMTSKRVRMVLGDSEEPPAFGPPPPRPLPENSHDSETATEEDPEYFPDDRDERCNIARPPSGN